MSKEKRGLSLILKTGSYRSAEADKTPQHLKVSAQERDQGIDFSPFFVGIDKRRISSGKAAAFVHRQEARMVRKMLTDMAESITKVETHLSKIDAYQKAGEKPALFHHSRKEYQSDLAYAKQQIKQVFEEGFSEYINYQEYYGFGDAFSEGYEPKEVKDLRPKDIRIALNPLATKLKNYIAAIETNLISISVDDKQIAKESASNLAKLQALVGQMNYELTQSQSQVTSMLINYEERIDNALDQIDHLDEMSELARKSAQSLILSRENPSSSLPHDIKEISMEKVQDLLEK